MDEDEFNEGENDSQSNDRSDKNKQLHSDEDQDDSKDGIQNQNNMPILDNDVGEIFNDEEIQNLKDIFDLFDKDQSGKIQSNDLENILTSLKRDPEEAKQMLDEIDPNHDGEITFNEFISLMGKIENKIDKKGEGVEENESEKQDGAGDGDGDGPKKTTIQTDSKVLDFLRLLEDYRAK